MAYCVGVFSWGRVPENLPVSVNDNWKVQGQIRNLFDEAGVMSWAAPGGFLASLDRQSVSQESIAANPNAIFGVAYDQPRSYWVTATYTF